MFFLCANANNLLFPKYNDYSTDSTNTPETPLIKSTNNKSSSLILRSTIGMSGTSKIFHLKKNGYYISQSIGQTSVIGTNKNKNYTIRQGYQQPLQQYYAKDKLNANTLKAKIFPNPVDQLIYISFNEIINDDIYISVSDITGRYITSKTFPPSRKVDLSLGELKNGIYLIKITSGAKNMITNFIKL
jgi:hypothetical protein